MMIIIIVVILVDSTAQLTTYCYCFATTTATAIAIAKGVQASSSTSRKLDGAAGSAVIMHFSYLRVRNSPLVPHLLLCLLVHRHMVALLYLPLLKWWPSSGKNIGNHDVI